MTERWVNSLRSRETPIRLAGEGATPAWTVRVQAAEAWDAVRVEVVPRTLVREVKQAAMAELMPDVDTVDGIDGFVVKLAGIEVDESATLESAGVQDGSTLLVMSRRRRAVR